MLKINSEDFKATLRAVILECVEENEGRSYSVDDLLTWFESEVGAQMNHLVETKSLVLVGTDQIELSDTYRDALTSKYAKLAARAQEKPESFAVNDTLGLASTNYQVAEMAILETLTQHKMYLTKLRTMIASQNFIEYQHIDSAIVALLISGKIIVDRIGQAPTERTVISLP